MRKGDTIHNRTNRKVDRDALTDWTPKLIATLTELWASGIPVREIGLRMGIGKNAVVGKAHRIGLPARESPIKTAGGPKPWKAKPQPRPFVLPRLPTLDTPPEALKPIRAAVPPKPAAPPVAPPALFKTCQWPVTDRQPWRFCDDVHVVPGRPYCAEHCKVAYRTAYEISPEVADKLGALAAGRNGQTARHIGVMGDE